MTVGKTDSVTGGYYDRLLTELQRSIPLVAVAYSLQVIDAVPAEPHDRKVHKIVTDREVIDCSAY